MKEKFDQIRELLKDLETESSRSDCTQGHQYSGVEVLEVVKEIVDDLHPLLTPYQVAFYWFLFKNSFLANGSEYLRVSTRALQSGVAKPSKADVVKMSMGHVQETLTALAHLGAIRKESEPDRAGTLYRVFLPHEIPSCIEHRIQREAPIAAPVDLAPDFYNIRENRIKIFERDSYLCTYCGKQLTQHTVTLDHVTPIEKGGSHSSENLVTSCLNCNSQKTNRNVGDFLAER
jgi:5-methylcytosine-specific restriction endonuclease McrA